METKASYLLWVLMLRTSQPRVHQWVSSWLHAEAYRHDLLRRLSQESKREACLIYLAFVLAAATHQRLRRGLSVWRRGAMQMMATLMSELQLAPRSLPARNQLAPGCTGKCGGFESASMPSPWTMLRTR